MSRLTERDEYGGAGIIGVNSADLIRDLDYDEPDRVNDALNKLFALEDILCPADAPEITLDELREMCKAKREGRVVMPKYNIGDTVYVIANCVGVKRELDGTWSSADGSPGTATGYYCAYDERWDECPLAANRDECDQNSYAVFEDTIEVIDIRRDGNSNNPDVYYGLSHINSYLGEIYDNLPEAESALAKEGEKQ